MNRRCYLLISFVVGVALLVVSCGDAQRCDPKSLAADDPAHVVERVLLSMATGKIDDSKIIYFDKHTPMPVVQHMSKQFHDVKFPIEEIKVCPFDPKTQTVEYSCVVPHPGVAFWQWKPRDPSDLQNVPAGLPMKGRFTLTQDKDAGWRVKVEDETNPIALYNGVVSSVNRTWYSFTDAGAQGRKVSGEAIGFNLLMLTAEYSISLGIPEKEDAAFGKRVLEEAMKIIPR
ncbi:MAG TPA: hypothetical protein VEX60_08205 [Pyrinomonadaceae bacterium]|nr:hypothetical protein [Pyrinomonadaceae bacterium]